MPLLDLIGGADQSLFAVVTIIEREAEREVWCKSQKFLMRQAGRSRRITDVKRVYAVVADLEKRERAAILQDYDCGTVEVVLANCPLADPHDLKTDALRDMLHVVEFKGFNDFVRQPRKQNGV